MHFRTSGVRAALVLVLPVGLALGAFPAQAQDSTTARTTPGMEIHGFVQVYYRAGDPTVKDGYRLRKADLKFSGDVSPHIRWRVGFDASKALNLTKTFTEVQDTAALSDAAIDQRSRMLQDAALTWSADKRLSFDVGQQIVPLGLEGTISTSNVETIERTLFIVERSRGSGLGDVRDIGVSANGVFTSGVEYHVAMFNETGESAGTTDANQQKSVMGRVAFHPSFLPGFQFGGSGGFHGGPPAQHRERGGTEVQFRSKSLTLRAETMAARDATLRRFGWYGLGVWRPTGATQISARYDSWDRDRTHESSVNDGYEQQVVLGASYLIDGTAAKVAVNVVHQTFPNISNAANGTFALVAFQGLW